LVAGGVVVVLALAAVAWSLSSTESPSGTSELSGSALNDLRQGGWRKAIAPHATLPVDPDVSAQAIAARIAQEYCGEPDVREVTHSNETTNDTRFFVPGCVPVDEGGENRLDFPEATLEVHPGELPTVGVRGMGSCHVNVGARYEGFGLCVTNLRKGQ
jgi:hypothetical protein